MSATSAKSINWTGTALCKQDKATCDLETKNLSLGLHKIEAKISNDDGFVKVDFWISVAEPPLRYENQDLKLDIESRSPESFPSAEYASNPLVYAIGKEAFVNFGETKPLSEEKEIVSWPFQLVTLKESVIRLEAPTKFRLILSEKTIVHSPNPQTLILQDGVLRISTRGFENSSLILHGLDFDFKVTVEKDSELILSRLSRDGEVGFELIVLEGQVQEPTKLEQGDVIFFTKTEFKKKPIPDLLSLNKAWKIFNDVTEPSPNKNVQDLINTKKYLSTLDTMGESNERELQKIQAMCLQKLHLHEILRERFEDNKEDEILYQVGVSWLKEEKFQNACRTFKSIHQPNLDAYLGLLTCSENQNEFRSARFYLKHIEWIKDEDPPAERLQIENLKAKQLITGTLGLMYERSSNPLKLTKDFVFASSFNPKAQIIFNLAKEVGLNSQWSQELQGRFFEEKPLREDGNIRFASTLQNSFSTLKKTELHFDLGFGFIGIPSKRYQDSVFYDIRLEQEMGPWKPGIIYGTTLNFDQHTKTRNEYDFDLEAFYPSSPRSNRQKTVGLSLEKSLSHFWLLTMRAIKHSLLYTQETLNPDSRERQQLELLSEYSRRQWSIDSKITFSAYEYPRRNSTKEEQATIFYAKASYEFRPLYKMQFLGKTQIQTHKNQEASFMKEATVGVGFETSL